MSYRIRKPLSVDERNAMGITSDLASHLLFHRGFTDSRTANQFLEPDYDRDVHDPMLLKDADKAATRIIQAIKNDEKIAIYADYDADGIPGATLFNDFFRRIGYSNFITYIPHRHDEGFGVNILAVEEIASNGVKLIITIDCGITDVLPVARAVELGIEVIITDHHEPPVQLPPAFAIIDHKQIGCEYPDKNICGSGVAYKLIQAILKKDRLGLKEGHEKWLLDMVGIATLSDMVPLVGENRALAYFGLAVLRKSPRKGLIRLLLKLKIAQKHLTEDDVGFMVTPRINAASRMGAPMDAFKLLSAETDDDANIFADKLEEVNNQRKGVVAALVKEVKKIITDRYGVNLPRAIVMGNPDWRPSLLGLAANSCAEEFDRPVFLWGRDGGNIIKGSCRSEGTSNIVEIMREAPAETFLQFGGHKHSGGFAVSNEQIHFLEKRLQQAADDIHNSKTKLASSYSRQIASMATNTLVSGGLIEEIEFQGTQENDHEWIDMELTLDAIDWTACNDISKLAPFGMNNPKPVFLFKNVAPVSVRTFGKTNNHIEFIFKKKYGTIPAIAFFGVAEKWAQLVQVNTTIDLVASVEKSMFRGRPELRLRVVDVIVK